MIYKIICLSNIQEVIAAKAEVLLDAKELG